jgi:hypothetical protein
MPSTKCSGPRGTADTSDSAVSRTSYYDRGLESQRSAYEHLLAIARLHAAGRYDRLTHGVAAIAGRSAASIPDDVAKHPELFGQRRRAATRSPRR